MNIDESVNESLRRNKIIEYIIKHPGCNAEKALRGVNDWMARATYYRCLRDLMHEGIVISGPKDKPKSRDHKLFVNTNNPLIIIPKELEQFENVFFVLLRKTVDTLEVHSDSSISYYLISRPLFLFYEMVNVYLILALCNWPRTVLEKDTLQKLYTVVFTKLGEIQFRINDILKSSKFPNAIRGVQSGVLWRYLYSTDKWLQCYEVCSKFGMEKEIESTLDSLWNIKKDYRLESHPEPSIFHWNYDYKRDGWKKLIELQLQHPEQTYDNHVNDSSNTSSLSRG